MGPVCFYNIFIVVRHWLLNWFNYINAQLQSRITGRLFLLKKPSLLNTGKFILLIIFLQLLEPNEKLQRTQKYMTYSTNKSKTNIHCSDIRKMHPITRMYRQTRVSIFLFKMPHSYFCNSVNYYNKTKKEHYETELKHKPKVEE